MGSFLFCTSTVNSNVIGGLCSSCAFKCVPTNIQHLPVWSKRASSCLHWLVPARIFLWLVVLETDEGKTEWTPSTRWHGWHGWIWFYASCAYSPSAPLGFYPQCQYRLHPPSSRFLHPNHVPETEPQRTAWYRHKSLQEVHTYNEDKNIRLRVNIWCKWKFRKWYICGSVPLFFTVLHVNCFFHRYIEIPKVIMAA